MVGVNSGYQQANAKKVQRDTKRTLPITAPKAEVAPGKDRGASSDHKEHQAHHCFGHRAPGTRFESPGVQDLEVNGTAAIGRGLDVKLVCLRPKSSPDLHVVISIRWTQYLVRDFLHCTQIESQGLTRKPF